MTSFIERQAAGLSALNAHSRIVGDGGEPLQDRLAGLIADLMHLCDDSDADLPTAIITGSAYYLNEKVQP